MDFGTHLRRTFLTGLFAAIPLAVTGWAIWFVDKHTRVFSPKIYGREIPILGVLIVLVAVYLLGVLVSTAVAKWFLTKLDGLLERLPMVRPAYRAWKQVSLNQGPGGSGMWDRVVLVSLEGDAGAIGFTSGHSVEGGGGALCVFVPSAPAPTTGRLLLVPQERCRLLDVSVEEAFKYILSGGNYIPPGTGTAWADLRGTARDELAGQPRNKAMGEGLGGEEKADAGAPAKAPVGDDGRILGEQGAHRLEGGIHVQP